jgi:putative hydrolase of the HAD superfamily
VTLGVTFDLDGTLATLDPPWPEVAATALGVGPKTEAVQTFGQTLREGLEAARADSIEHAAAATVSDHPLDRDPAEIAQAFRDREVAATVAVPGARRVVERISEARPTGIVTNGDDSLQRRKAATLGLSECVDTVVVSGGVGVRKPDAAIFEVAGDRLGADRYLHVGDDRAEDVGGALAAGWEAVHLERGADPDDPVATISNLSRFADLL